MKIGIVANCQGQILMNALQKLPNVESVIWLPVHVFGSEQYKIAKEKFDILKREREAVILTQSIGDRFEDYQTANLKQKSEAQVLTISNLFFSGLHPDISYAGFQGQRFQSPMGDYHSKIILHSFFQGKNQRECYESFNSETYARFGFFDEFQKSEYELRNRETHLDISFCNQFIELIRNEPSMYTVNHPLPFVFHKFSNLIAQKLGLTHYEIPFHYLENFLALNAWWPIYPEIGKHHQLTYETPMLFKQPNPWGGKLLSLELLIEKSYTHYNFIKDNLSKAEQVKNLIEI